MILVVCLVAVLVPTSVVGAGQAGGEPNTTEPVGEDTTSPESSGEDATAPATWFWYVLAGAAAGGVAVFLVNRRRASEGSGVGSSGAGGSPES